MNNSTTPEHLKNPHLSAWSIGLTIAGCSLAMFSPLAINKNPQLGIVGTSAGAVLSIAGWVMGSQSEKSIKLQAKVEEQTEAIFLRRLGMEYELEKFRDIRYLNESQQAIAQPKSHDQTLPPSQQRRSDDNEGNLHRSQLMVLDRESPVEYNQENHDIYSDELSFIPCDIPSNHILNFYNWDKLADESSGILIGGNSGSAKTSLGAGFVIGKLTEHKPAEVIVLDIHASKNPIWQQMGFPRVESDVEIIYQILCWLIEEVENRKEKDGHSIIVCLDEINDTMSELAQLDTIKPLQNKEKRVKTFTYAIRKLSNARKFDICLIGFMQSHNTEAIGIDGKFRNNFLLILCGASARSEIQNLWKHDTPEFQYIQSAAYPVVVCGSNQHQIAEHPTHKHHLEYRKKGNAPDGLLNPIFLNKPIDVKIVPSPNINLKKDDVPKVLQSINPLDCNTWQSIDYPSGLQWLPQHEAGVYCVFVDGYQNPLYVGQSKDLWRRWNNKGDWEHHVKKHLESIGDVSVKIAFYITKNWDEQKRLTLESELQAKYKPSWNGTANKTLPDKTLSESAQAVFNFIKEIFKGEPIPARDCYRKSSLRTQFGLNAETTELIFDELQNFGLGQKLIKEINGFRSVNFLPDM
jgi:hypothetical protein